ncbi:MAG TPA: class I SAM-dependent methyltransferase [Thermomicrobiales bacterium]|nr:class I SAM-dependent methyltransferase [Thermomicrobiales bacterium]
MPARNAYTPTWFDLFLASQVPARTDREVAFLTRVLPTPPGRLLDVCCGYGRHAAPLTEAGYDVVGIDRDERAIARARSLHAHDRTTFLVHDMTMIRALPGPFEGIICMWQSFGYHDADTNADILRQMARCLVPGGKVVLDLYNRDFFGTRQGERTTIQEGVEIVTRQRLDGDRLIVDLDYRDHDERETFDWQVFTPHTITDLAISVGFEPVLACTAFNEPLPPSPDSPRMQMVFATS